MNALKHGLRSGHTLLPGDDVAAFRRLRHELFHLYRPRTGEEARYIETIAAAQWRIARCRLMQAGFDRHLGAVLSGHPDASGYVCEPDPHQLFHRSMDCVLQEGRLDRLMARAEAKLALLQKQRAQNFTVAEGLLQEVEALLAAGEPVVEVERPAAAARAVPATPASGSGERRIQNRARRQVAAAAPPFPAPWQADPSPGAAHAGAVPALP